MPAKVMLMAESIMGGICKVVVKYSMRIDSKDRVIA
jgi:hypothetical protein